MMAKTNYNSYVGIEGCSAPSRPLQCSFERKGGGDVWIKGLPTIPSTVLRAGVGLPDSE